MSKLQLLQSLRDVLPTHSGDFPPQLVSYVDSLYLLSTQKIPVLPLRADVARYHLCAYLGVERCQEKLKLPHPLLQKIPAQPKVVERLLEDLRENVVSGNSPTSTPRKRPISPSKLPAKRHNVPKISSPLKKLQSLADSSPKAADFAMESPFNPKSTSLTAEEDTPIKNKTAQESPFQSSKSPVKTPKKSPLKRTLSATASPGSPRYVRHLTIADFISFANNFYIPSSVTPQMVESFMAEKHKFTKKNEWLLACGLVHAAYIRINDKLIQNTIGKKTELQDQLFQYQKGGLMKSNMVMWINIIEETVKVEPWMVDLEVKYVHNNWSQEDNSQVRELHAKLGRGWDLLQGFGSMINPLVMFDKKSQLDYFSTWTNKLRAKVEEVEVNK